MKLLAVTRVSGLAQEDNNSLETQRKAIENWAKANNSDVIFTDSIVESATCSMSERPKFMEALEQMSRLNCDGLIVYHLDRFFRNTEEGLRCARVEFQEKDKTLVSVSQSIDFNRDDGWFMFTMYLAFAENEARRNKTRFREGKQAKKLKGGYLGGEPPYGWQPDGNGGLIENAHEQEIRNWILTKPANQSARSIAIELNRRGQLTRKGCEWQSKQVQSIREAAERKLRAV